LIAAPIHFYPGTLIPLPEEERVQMEELRVRISLEKLPASHTCDGEDKSPRVTIDGIDTGEQIRLLSL
jgi:hypothetical protein